MANRRTFLKASSAFTGAAIAGVRWDSAHAANSPHARESSIDPIARNGKAMFKYSLAAYSYRSLLQGNDATMDLDGFIDDCAALDLQGTELTSYYFPEAVTPVYLRQLKRHCFRLGLDVSGTAVGNDFGFPEGKERRQQIEHVKRWITYAEILGAPVIRIFAGHKKEGTTEAQSHSLMVAAIEECCEFAGQHGIHLALENHGGPTATAAGLMKFVRDVNSPWFGVNLDSGNFHSEDVYRELAEVAPYALNVQVKVSTSGPDGKKVPTDFKRLARLLKDAHYRGYVVLEFEENGDPRTECRRYMEAMRTDFESVLADQD